jgi:hypothetical protein
MYGSSNSSPELYEAPHRAGILFSFILPFLRDKESNIDITMLIVCERTFLTSSFEPAGRLS